MRRVAWGLLALAAAGCVDFADFHGGVTNLSGRSVSGTLDVARWESGTQVPVRAADFSVDVRGYFLMGKISGLEADYVASVRLDNGTSATLRFHFDHENGPSSFDVALWDDKVLLGTTAHH